MAKTPVAVTIPTPVHGPRGRGIFATTPGEQLRVRVNKLEKQVIAEVAKELGVSMSEFVRWVTYHAAREYRDARQRGADQD